MTRDLYFLASRSTPSGAADTYAPCRMKATTDPAADPLIAFSVASLGEQFMVGRGIGSECAIVPFASLGPSVAADVRIQRILLFDSTEVLSRYLEQGHDFAFEPHIKSFVDAYAGVQDAL